MMEKILLVSTDPASNIGQVFGVKIGNHITPIETITGLCGLEIDPQAAAQNYRDRITAPVRGVLPDKTVKGSRNSSLGPARRKLQPLMNLPVFLLTLILQKNLITLSLIQRLRDIQFAYSSCLEPGVIF